MKVMEITYIGHSSFLFKAKKTKLITDPFGNIGTSFPKGYTSHIVTVSHQHSDHNNVNVIRDNPLVIDWPGEFESQGVRVTGFQSFHDASKGQERGENIIYKIEMEDIDILHMGDQGVTPDQKIIDEIGNVDILMIPVGGFFTIDAGEAKQIVNKLDPSIVIPMHYNQSFLNQETFGKLDPVEIFLQKMSIEQKKEEEYLSVTKEQLSDKQMEVVVLKAQVNK